MVTFTPQVASVAAMPQATQTFPAPTSPPTEPPKASSKKTFTTPTIIALAVVIIIFILVSVFVFAAFFANMNQTSTNNQANVNEDSFLHSGMQTQADTAVQNIVSRAGFTFLPSEGFHLVHLPPP